MNKRTTWTLGSIGAAVLLIGGGLAVSIPAQASNTTPDPTISQTGVEDGTNDGETADDTGTDTGIEDGTNDGEIADAATETEDPTEANDPNEVEDSTGVEDGTNDGETADDTTSTTK
ncbi:MULTISPECIES: hypothetical protein [unclassified Microbacterium]|uniref:hypothetical protein n=1 Tax=unclassified Microbacterium TaxID=2609290 RepID=UPI001781149F|nr:MULTISPECIES: hypothetical protein [unclassified Microbacterium]MBD8205866.1 hypothetical protein [Microbacterium sp. CFBP 8801]MBD8476699.1 hypothetical protein [Microbacterium sp. CFBP 8794]MBD8509440.1 hypothetical protein [Microbacterium sp. CFBP 8790]